MIWIVLALVAVVLVVLAFVAVLDDDSVERAVDDVDPLFPTGIAIAGAGVALAVTLGGFMYTLLVVGLIVMAIGAVRTHHAHHRRSAR